MKQHRTGLRWSLPINMQLPKAKELPPCNTEPPITTWTHSQICMHLAKLTIKPTSLYVAECCVRYHSPESSWFLGIVNISYTGTCRGKERRLSEWYLQESCQGVLEKQNALVKSIVYLLFFFLHPLCLYVYRVSLECSHLEKQYLCFLVEEFCSFFSSSAIKTQGLFWWHSWFLGQAFLNQSYPSAFQLWSSLIFHLCAT